MQSITDSQSVSRRDVIVDGQIEVAAYRTEPVTRVKRPARPSRIELRLRVEKVIDREAYLCIVAKGVAERAIVDSGRCKPRSTVEIRQAPDQSIEHGCAQVTQGPSDRSVGLPDRQLYTAPACR